jgi:hypothetical protein
VYHFVGVESISGCQREMAYFFTIHLINSHSVIKELGEKFFHDNGVAIQSSRN